MATLRLFVLRHGETEYSRERRFAGARDVPLTALGLRQCEAAAARLAGTAVTAVYASPLERARASAEAIAKPHRLPVQVDPAFREMAFGAWEGLTRSEFTARFPEAARAWEDAPETVAPPGGETLAQVAERVEAGLAALLAGHPEQTLVLVTHGVVTRLLVLAALGLGPDRLWSVECSPAGITELTYEPGWATVHRMNTLAHLEALA